MLKKGLSSAVAVFLCLFAQSQSCHVTLSKAQQLLKERDYRSCIELLNDADCDSYEYYNILMTAHIGAQDYMSVRQWAERHEGADAGGRTPRREIPCAEARADMSRKQVTTLSRWLWKLFAITIPIS